MKPALGFIGLGAMGSRIARRLLDAGYPLTVYNRTPDKTHPLADAGARVSDSPALLAQQSDIVLTMLSDDAAVEAVLFSADGVLAGTRPGTTLIDLSSVYPDTSRSIVAAAARQGLAVLDAPVSGSTPQAQAGSLIVYVGGDAAVYERCRPILNVIGGVSYLMGPNGAGATMKLVINSLLGLEMQALAEALTLGERAGLNRTALIDVLSQSSVVTAGQKAKLQNAQAKSYPVQFALRLMWKDLGNVLRLAHERQVSVPATAAAHEIFAIEQRKGVEEDFSAVIQTMEDLAGAQVLRAT
ncbi:MAG TPA: NAD(P)-dependent oxidoreductase [Chloroflexota bacterium]|nr:NAD(P)-dependent oxidoreductase [Chloroflexota bacterium]